MRVRSSARFASLALSLLCGCHLYTVQKASTDDASPGVPFFAMEAVRTDTTQYEKRWWRIDITLTMGTTKGVPNGSAPTGLEIKPAPRRTYSLHAIDANTASEVAHAFATARDLDEAYAYLETNLPPPPSAADLAASAISGAPLPTLRAGVVRGSPELLDVLEACHTSSSKFRIASRASTYSQRPARELLYLNVERPVIGSAEGALELNANGTLKSTNAKADPKAAEVIGAGIAAASTVATPFAAAAAGKFVYDAAVALAKIKATDAATQKALFKARVVPLEITLNLTPIRQVVRFDATVQANDDYKVVPDATCTVGKDASISSRLEVVTTTAPDAGKAEKKDNEVSFTGTIALPKPAADPK